jgi:Tol biopolymer transport system component
MMILPKHFCRVSNSTLIISRRLAVLTVLFFYPSVISFAGNFQFVSQPSSSVINYCYGNGDSGQSVMSPDGRFVLFTGTANNLTVTTNGNPIPVLVPPKLNVYLRDLSNEVTTLVSVNASGTGGGNGDSLAMGISTNGRYALFESSATDLLPADTNGVNDIFLRDLVQGTTTLVSVSTNGGFGNGISRTPVMTPDGRYVVFVSSANNLVPGDTNGIPDIFVRDTQLGVTTLASPGAMSPGLTTTNGSASPAITPDGRDVLFYSSATNLVPGQTNVSDIFVRDLTGGITYWVSGNARAIQQSVLGTANGVCFSAKINPNGTYVAYEVSPANFTSVTGVVLRYNLQTEETDIVNTNANAPVGNYEDIRTVDISDDGSVVASVGNIDKKGENTSVYLWNAVTGTNLLASPAWSSNAPAAGVSYAPVLDASGRYVAFLSDSTNVIANTLPANSWNLYVYDSQSGTITLVDANANNAGTGVDAETYPNWSADARFITYEQADTADRNQYFNVTVADLVSNTTEIVSVPNPSFVFASPDGLSQLFPVCASTNASYIAFASDADNLVPNCTNGYRNVFVSDLAAGTLMLVSVDTNGNAAAGCSSQPSISGNGRYVAFSSTADSLVAGDTNGAQDIFVRDLQAGTTTLVSVNTNGTGSGNANSYSPVISGDGRFVLFQSVAQNLAAGNFGSSIPNLFLRDMQLGTNYALTRATSGSGLVSASMTPDGHYIAFIGPLAGSTLDLYVWDSDQALLIYTNTTSSLLQASISPNGQRLAYTTSGTSSGNLYIADLAAPSNNATVASSAFNYDTSRNGLSFSGDSRYLVYTASTTATGTNNVYLYDILAKTNFLISQTVGGDEPTNTFSFSDSPVISPDGRFVAFRSSVTNIVPGNLNGAANYFLFDRNSGAMTLLTASQFGNYSGQNCTANAFFSPDGQTLLLQSAAGDLVTNDFNRSGDVFAFNLFAAGMIPIFTVQAVVSSQSNPNVTLIWPVLPGKTYQVLFKNNLTDPAWQVLPGNVTILGNTGYFTDASPPIGQRFYQIIGN